MTNINEYIFPKNKKIKFNRYSKIISTGSHLPDRVVTNDDIIRENSLKVTDSVIRKTIGVANRREAEQGASDSDILCKAALDCLGKVNLVPENISKLIVTKFIGDRILPMTASMLQRKLGSNLAFHALDVDGGINSFLSALNLATRYISTSMDEQNILIASGGLNRIAVSNNDPRIAFLFGDGAGAILLKEDNDPHFLASYEFTNWNHVNFAGSRDLKFSPEISERIFEQGEYSLLQDLYTMSNWKDTKDFYTKSIIHTKNMLLEQADMKFQDIDLILLTENNQQMTNLALESLKVPIEKNISLIEEYGNTMSAMLPILLDHVFTNNLVDTGMNIMLLSFGEGISGGGIIYRV